MTHPMKPAPTCETWKFSEQRRDERKYAMDRLREFSEAVKAAAAHPTGSDQ